ncbi:hypothetical protein [Streptomyces sp. 8L]|nr:hypothetical protein [Streptomyces sp. 8L]
MDTPQTDTAQTPLDRFEQQHANQPIEDWQDVDHEIYQNLHLTA